MVRRAVFEDNEGVVPTLGDLVPEAPSTGPPVDGGLGGGFGDIVGGGADSATPISENDYRGPYDDFDLDGSEQPTFDLDGSEQPTFDLDGSEQPTFDLDGSEQPTFDLDGSEQPTFDLDGSEQPTFDLDGSEDPGSFGGGGSAPFTMTADDLRATSTGLFYDETSDGGDVVVSDNPDPVDGDVVVSDEPYPSDDGTIQDDSGGGGGIGVFGADVEAPTTGVFQYDFGDQVLQVEDSWDGDSLHVEDSWQGEPVDYPELEEELPPEGAEVP